MIFTVFGISHKTSPIALREKFYLDQSERELLINGLRQEPSIAEALIISTCNRTEIYALMSESDPLVLRRRLCSLKNISSSQSLSNAFYTYSGPVAIRHLFEVACGLDSLIVGEKEILGQVKIAIDLARKKEMFGRFLNILTNIVLGAAKRARTETKISIGGSSVSWAAVQRAEQAIGTLKGKTVLLIGAGKMSHMAAGDFQRKGVGQLYVLNRTREKGEELARKFMGTAVDFFELRNILKEVDVCITSASAPHYLIEPRIVREVMAEKKGDLLMIDISMPRNIHPCVGDINNVTLIGLDELDKVVGNNIKQREEAIHEVEEIIASQVEKFSNKWASALLFSDGNSRVLSERAA